MSFAIGPMSDPSNEGGPPTVDIPLTSLTTYSLLEICPVGYLPKCVKKQVIYSMDKQTSPMMRSSASSQQSCSASVVGQAGTQYQIPPYPVGTRLRFHFRTTCTQTGTLIDDTRHGVRPKPMELIVGKGFKMEIWELALNTMKEGEVSKFIVPQEMCLFYPIIANVAKRIFTNTCQPSQKELDTNENCSMTPSCTESEVEDDPNKSASKTLTFAFELLEVSLPNEYNIQALYTHPLQGQLSSTNSGFSFSGNESALTLESRADKLLVSRDYQGAALKYSEALNKLNSQQYTSNFPANPEMDDERIRIKVSILMKAAYCKLNSKEYSESIDLLSAVLTINPDNSTALFRRGRCNVQTRNYEQAKRDFAQAVQLDPTLLKAVKVELSLIEAEERRAIGVKNQTVSQVNQI